MVAWSTRDAEARSQRFDGNWSVYIYGATSGCTFKYRLPITVRNGDILYKGSRVHPTVIGLNSSGAVAINLGSGASAVTGSGALSSTRGSGRWSAPRYRCNGWWRAEKR